MGAGYFLWEFWGEELSEKSRIGGNPVL